MYYLKLIDAPFQLPLTLEEVKMHLRVDGTDEDAYLDMLQKSAVNQVQNITNRQLMEAQYRLSMDCLPDKFNVPRPPFIEIAAFTAKNSEGDTVDFAETPEWYTLTDDEYTTVRGVEGSGWFDSSYTDVVFQYTAGYAGAEFVPEDIKSALLLIIGNMYANREDGTRKMPMASEMMLTPYRIINN